MAFSIFNGFMQGHYLLNYYLYDEQWLTSPQFIIGFTMFCVGMAINIHSDQQLIHLRKPGETGYKMPVGGLFEYVTAPNFFAEIIEWIGFAIASCSPPAAVFAFFSTVFLCYRAWHHHHFYLKKFDNYPRSRKIIIPFVF
ncbi:3-oxo-5-alpha-steroid 4-dehydrogenase 1-like [Daphnia pulicaria]|nr:3-oxo-5-alpha-steroid 4-dehydrogenase 1-like [Daphnia pulicaria]